MTHQECSKLSPEQDKGLQQFDIHEKLKQEIKNSGKSHSYMMAAQPHQGNANFEFITSLFPELLFLIYKRIDEYFVLVDFFKTYEEACDEAKTIIDSRPRLKASLNSWIEHSKNN